MSAPVLALPSDGGQYVLDTDASDHGIGAVLSQVQDGEERVLAFASRLYSDAEKRYCVTRKDCWPWFALLSNFVNTSWGSLLWSGPIMRRCNG